MLLFYRSIVLQFRNQFDSVTMHVLFAFFVICDVND